MSEGLDGGEVQNINKILQTVREQLAGLPEHHNHILVGVSGGADSVCLLRVLLAIKETEGIRLSACHFDHAIRVESSSDAQWVAQLCRDFDVPFFSARRTDQGEISEEGARKLRYEFFENTLRESEASLLAVAHNRNDVVETVVHHLIRGTGLRGLSGIPVSRKLHNGNLIRPLRSVSRQAIEAALLELEQEFLLDSTNSENRYTRNKIRNELIPTVVREYNPKFEDAVFRLSEQATDLQAAVDVIVEQIASECFLSLTCQSIRIRIDNLQKHSPVLIRACLQSLWKKAGWRHQALSAAHLERLQEMILSGEPRRLSLAHAKEAVRKKNVLELRDVLLTSLEGRELAPRDSGIADSSRESG